MKSLLQHDSTKQRKFKHIVVDTLRGNQDYKRTETIMDTLDGRKESQLQVTVEARNLDIRSL